MWYGYAGTILNVDLTTRAVRKEALDQEMARQYIGGAGLAARLLYERSDPRGDPYAPSAPLIFATGPVVGTLIPLSGRHAVCAKSPQTGTIGWSLSGGWWGAQLKFAGVDVLVVTGCAEQPVYLWIDDDKVELRDAHGLWGLDAADTEDRIREELEDPMIEVSCIGQSGENLVRYAGIVNNKHNLAGRGGMGAVMGSKRLKAVAVRGTKDVSVPDPKEFFKQRNAMANRLKKSDFYKFFPDTGTSITMEVANYFGIFPTRNFQEGVLEDIEKIDSITIRKELVTKSKTCFACIVNCNKVVSLNEPGGALITDRGEYETYFALGSACGVNDLNAIVKAGHRCDLLGLDTISTGTSISFAIECFERGLLTREQCDGRELKWGDGQLVLDLVEDIAHRRGLGDLLAEGSKRAAKKIGGGAHELAMEVKGMELAGYDPRGMKGMGLTYAVGTRGADHNYAYTISKEMWARSVDRFTTEGKAELVCKISDLSAVVKSLIVCTFPSDNNEWELPALAQMLQIVTGWEYSEEELARVGERIVNLEKLYNLRAGLTRADDRLPKRFINEMLPEGPSAGQTVDLEVMLTEYYRLRGWSLQGVPTRAKLAELGLLDLAAMPISGAQRSHQPQVLEK